MEKRGVPVVDSFHKSGKAIELPPLVFVAGEDYMLVPMDDGSVFMEIGEECRDDKRFDPVVYLFVHYLHQETTTNLNSAVERMHMAQDLDSPCKPISYTSHTRSTAEFRLKQDVELAARFIQIAFRFAYNKNTVKGLFFYCKMHDIKNGDRYKEAMAMANGPFNAEVAATLNEICQGIII